MINKSLQLRDVFLPRSSQSRQKDHNKAQCHSQASGNPEKSNGKYTLTMDPCFRRDDIEKKIMRTLRILFVFVVRFLSPHHHCKRDQNLLHLVIG